MNARTATTTLRAPVGSARLAAAGLALATVALLALEATPAAAQTASVRAVETVDPSTGRRAVELMRPLTPGEVAAVERRLAEIGYRPGEPDGALDARSRRALEAFQRDEGLGPCGCVDVATVRRLDLGLRVLVTRIVSASTGDGEGRVPDSGQGVETVYPSTVAPSGPAPSPGGQGGDAATAADEHPPATAWPVPRTGVPWRGGHVLPVPVPVIVGPDGSVPAPVEPRIDGAPRGVPARPKPFPRVPFPRPWRPGPPAGSG